MSDELKKELKEELKDIEFRRYMAKYLKAEMKIIYTCRLCKDVEFPKYNMEENKKFIVKHYIEKHQKPKRIFCALCNLEILNGEIFEFNSREKPIHNNCPNIKGKIYDLEYAEFNAKRRLLRLKEDMKYISEDDLNGEFLASFVNFNDEFSLLKFSESCEFGLGLFKDLLIDTRPYWVHIKPHHVYFGMSLKNYVKLIEMMEGDSNYASRIKHRNKNSFEDNKLFGVNIIVNDVFQDWIYIFPLSALMSLDGKCKIINFRSIGRRKIL